jgi:hypothetical protein
MLCGAYFDINRLGIAHEAPRDNMVAHAILVSMKKRGRTLLLLMYGSSCWTI